MKICFVSLEATRLFVPASPKIFGGAEWRAAIFARLLAARGEHEVTIVLGARDPRPPASEASLRLLFDPTFDQRKKHFPWVRWDRFRPGLLLDIPRAGFERFARGRTRGSPRILGCYRRLDADVTCVFGVNDLSAHVIASRRAAGARTLLFLTSDTDLNGSFRPDAGPLGAYGVSGSLAFFTLQHADEIVVQTEVQRRLLRERFNRGSTVIRNPVDTTPLDGPLRAERDGVLWVGRADVNVKRPHAGFDVAARCPELAFLFVMNREKRSAFEACVNQAPPNVEIVERVEPDAIAGVFARAQAFLNTASFEGFPNTFLQAAVHRVPYLSLEVDPGGVFAAEDVGVCARGDAGLLAAALREAVALRGGWPERVERAGVYVRRHHAAAARVAELDALVRTMGA